METIARKPHEVQYDYVKMTVKQYMAFFDVAESTVHARIERVKNGTIPRDVLDIEQLAPYYPISLIVRVRKNYHEVLKSCAT